MPYVHMDAEGRILAVYTEHVEGAVEVDPNDPALTEFIQNNIPSAVNTSDEWVQSDLSLARVIEDLIEVLIDKKVIMFTDFPEGAQEKLRARRGFRREFSLVEDLFGGGEDDDDHFDDGEGGLL